jgi:hypothetical protein
VTQTPGPLPPPEPPERRRPFIDDDQLLAAILAVLAIGIVFALFVYDGGR